MRLAVVGTGYVGLVAGTCLAETGNRVICVDKDAAKIAALNRGEIPIYEPGLGEMVARNAQDERLSFTTDLDAATQASEVIFLAVGTPQDVDGSADMSFVIEVARAVAKAMNGPKIIVVKSTVPVGTSTRLREEMARITSHSFSVVSNPEFMKEGAALDDFLKPDRVVIGTTNPEAEAVLRHLYEPFLRTGKPLLCMDPASAELSKYASNAMLATRISFMNEIANLCDRVGANAQQVRIGMGTDGRIGSSFLFAGLGYGGSCFPKDVKALTRMGAEHDSPMRVAAAVDEVNERQKVLLADRIEKHLGVLEGKVVAIWGLAFKPRTDDIREAPAMALIPVLLDRGAMVRAYDPKAMPAVGRVLGDRITLCPNGYAAAQGADALAVVTEWNEFREPDFERLKKMMRNPAVFDGRNLYAPHEVRRYGFHYEGIGRR
jgi:UDPglucose 6-dehydrogenase